MVKWWSGLVEEPQLYPASLYTEQLQRMAGSL